MSALRPLTPLEIACGIVLPQRVRSPRLPNAHATPRAALEAAIEPALRRSPCLVSFSGGRDSSAVLAAAVAVARRERLPLPIPVTHRFPAAAGADESEWQEQVVAHLGLDDWLRIEAAAELDAIGPVATAAMQRHGLLWPCNTYFHAPIFDAAKGGAVLTGIGGDEAFSASSWDRPLAVLAGRVRPRPRDVLNVGFTLSPVPVKAAVIRRRMPELFPWLQPAARREVEAWLAADVAREPLRRSRRLQRLAGSPVLEFGLAGLAALAADRVAVIIHPLHDPGFLAALAALPSAEQRRTRSESMRALVGDLLPAPVLSRSTKAHFSEVLWGPASRELAAGWDGKGFDPDIVDAGRLHEIWASDQPDTQTITLLQSLWLTRARAGVRRPRAATPSPAAG